ncbi:MAG: hypothetical protein EZS28_040645, partial [Streblomastix strix]
MYVAIFSFILLFRLVSLRVRYFLKLISAKFGPLQLFHGQYTSLVSSWQLFTLQGESELADASKLFGYLSDAGFCKLAFLLISCSLD